MSQLSVGQELRMHALGQAVIYARDRRAADIDMVTNDVVEAAEMFRRFLMPRGGGDGPMPIPPVDPPDVREQ